jgi:alkylated DNA repair dioxygenase AlkB
MADQLTMFEPARPALPDGFRYQADVITVAAEAELVRNIEALPFEHFKFHGYTGNRRVVSFGWKYDYTARLLNQADDMPDFLRALRITVAKFAGLDAARLQQALVTEYSPGSAIGWHKDKPEYGEVVGLSLLAPCTFRLRRDVDGKWERVNLTAEPRSAYLLSGASRNAWEHSIPPVDALRYSITFRNLRND